MKQAFFLIIIFNFLIASAQQFKGGFRCGIVASQVRGDKLTGFNKLGLTGGPTLAYPLKNDANISLELLFVQKGSRKNPTEEDPTRFIMRINYIELPILYRQKINKIGYEAGLSFGILLKNFGGEYDLYGKVPTRYPFEPFEYCLQLGMRYFFNDNNCINFRYSNSLLPIRKLPDIPNYHLFFDRGQLNFVISFTYEYQF